MLVYRRVYTSFRPPCPARGRRSGILPESVCGFQDSSWAEKWWEQCPVARASEGNGWNQGGKTHFMGKHDDQLGD